MEPGSPAGPSGVVEAFNMGRNEDAEVEEPTMRAVAMMSVPPLVEDFRTFGAKPPPLGISRPSVGLQDKSTDCPENFGLKEEWNGLAPPSAWDVKEEDLEMVPEDFPLERTHRAIKGVAASVVASRISEVLRSHSIEAEYDCRNAKAKCKTSDYVNFRIRLYAGSKSGDPVVVEVQRRCGSASSFMSSCRAILNAAEGKCTDDSSSAPRKMPPFMKKPLSQMKCLGAVIPKHSDYASDSISALDSVMEMLKSNQRDSNVLGMENLCTLTDPIKTNPAVAIRVSKCVVLGDANYEIREEIRVLTERDVYGPELEQGPRKHVEHLRHLALWAFANALGMCSKDGCLASAETEQKWFADYLVPSLVDEIKRAPSNACNACMSASCLCSLVGCSEIARRQALSYGGVDALEEAHEFGKAQNDLLANETARCLKELDVRPRRKSPR